MSLFYFFTFLINPVLIQGRTEVASLFNPFTNQSHLSVYANALSKVHFNPWGCDFKIEPGYKCLGCYEALHCFPGNFALLVQCSGLLQFCRRGRCSLFKDSECDDNDMYTEGTHGPLQVTTVANDKITISEKPNLATVVTVTEESSPNTNTTTDLTSLNEVDEIITSTVTAGTDNSNIQKDPRDLF